MIQDVCNRIKYLRIKNGLNQKKFGEKINMSARMISYLENNQLEVTLEMILQIVKEFNVDLQWLITGEGKY